MEIYVDSVREVTEKQHLSISQRQPIIKLIEKKKRGKIFLLNVDLNIISKALSEKLREVLPDLICSQQTAYVENILAQC